MALSNDQKNHIKEVLKECIRSKFENYNPETDNMPFHYRLLGKDRMALFSFIHSLNTTFGVSIYEPVAKELGKLRFRFVDTQVKPHDFISSDAQAAIQRIVDRISTAEVLPNKIDELNQIREGCQSGSLNRVKLRKIDICLENNNGELYFFDIKTVKPNIGGFEDYKRMLLNWAAAEMARNPDVNIRTLLAIPYNPYAPQPYNRWTMRGMFDLQNEIMVAEEFWDFLAGEGTYQDLLDCFELAGIELRPEIDNYFSRFNIE